MEETIRGLMQCERDTPHSALLLLLLGRARKAPANCYTDVRKALMASWQLLLVMKARARLRCTPGFLPYRPQCGPARIKNRTRKLPASKVTSIWGTHSSTDSLLVRHRVARVSRARQALSESNVRRA